MHSDEERFAEKIRVEGDCWIWTGATNSRGYAAFWVNGKLRRAHRWAYEFMIGEIPTGLTLDHLCRNTLCVNPFHCEPVTIQENIRRGERSTKRYCIHGHKLFGENLYVAKNGKRLCRICRRRIHYAWWVRNKRMPEVDKWA